MRRNRRRNGGLGGRGAGGRPGLSGATGTSAAGPGPLVQVAVPRCAPPPVNPVPTRRQAVIQPGADSTGGQPVSSCENHLLSHVARGARGGARAGGHPGCGDRGWAVNSRGVRASPAALPGPKIIRPWGKPAGAAFDAETSGTSCLGSCGQALTKAPQEDLGDPAADRSRWKPRAGSTVRYLASPRGLGHRAAPTPLAGGAKLFQPAGFGARSPTRESSERGGPGLVPVSVRLGSERPSFVRRLSSRSGENPRFQLFGRRDHNGPPHPWRVCGVWEVGSVRWGREGGAIAGSTG